MTRRILSATVLTPAADCRCTHAIGMDGKKYVVDPPVDMLEAREYTMHLYSDMTCEVHIGRVVPEGWSRHIRYGED